MNCLKRQWFIKTQCLIGKCFYVLCICLYLLPAFLFQKDIAA